MNCPQIEQLLSEYMESGLPAADRNLVEKHLERCERCAVLLEEMRSALSLCRSYPNLEMPADLTEKILLRTSGRPRTRSILEVIRQYFLRPLLTPRFAVGAGLATLFLVILTHLTVPRISTAFSVLSTTDIFALMDRGVQRLYGEGLKAYEKKNEWQAQIFYLKNNLFNRLNFVFEQFETPIEGGNQPEEPWQKQEKAPRNKNSSLFSFPV